MIPPGITIEGVPLEDHLTDKKRKRFFESIENEVREEKDIIYHNSKTKCRQRHNTRPGKVRHLSKEEYMGTEPKSAGERILITLIIGSDEWFSIKDFHKLIPEVGTRALAQAIIRLLERFPEIVFKRFRSGREMEYSINPECNISDDDALKLLRKEITLEYLGNKYVVFGTYLIGRSKLPDKVRGPAIPKDKTLLEHVKDLEHHLAQAQLQISQLKDRIDILEIDSEATKIKTDSLDQAQLQISQLKNRIDILEIHSEATKIKTDSLDHVEVAKDSGVNINIHLIDPRDLK